MLGERDRADVLRSRYRAVMSLCCPMPPSSAAALLGLVDAGGWTSWRVCGGSRRAKAEGSTSPCPTGRSRARTRWSTR
ncbi:hypothetical protein ACFQ3Z_08645 [Streptomyces nogalater]